MKQRKTVFQLLVITALMMIFGSCGDNDIVARVGNHVIYLQDLNEALDSSRLGPQARQSYSEMVNFLNTLVDEQLITIDAYRKGLDTDSTVLYTAKDTEERQVYLDVIQNQVIGKVIPERMVREKYNHNAYEYKVRHIFLHAGQSPKEQIKKLEELRSQILRGADFAALARQFSQDSLSAGKGGDLGFLRWGANDWGDAFYAAISKLKTGQVSDVIKSGKGLHLVLVEQVRAVDQPPFEEQKEKLQRDFFRTHVEQLDSTFYGFVDDLKKSYNSHVIDANVDSLVAYVKNTTTDELNPRRDPLSFLRHMDQETQTMPLAVYTKGAYTVTDMYQTYQNISPMRRPVLADTAAIQEFLRRNIPRTLVIQYGYDHGVQKKASIRQAVKKEKEKSMRLVDRNQTIMDKLDPTEEEVRQRYEEKASYYEIGSKVKIQEIKVYSQEKALDLYQQIESGTSFETLLEEYAPDQLDVASLKFLSASDYGLVSRNAVRLEVGEITEPLKNGNSYSIIKVVDRRPGTLPPYDEIKNRIRRELRVDMRRELQDEWLSNLRETIPVVVYEHAIRKEFGFTND